MVFNEQENKVKPPVSMFESHPVPHSFLQIDMGDLCALGVNSGSSSPPSSSALMFE